MKIERWNCNTLRRYHHDSGAIVVVSRTFYGRHCSIIPASTRHISVRVEPAAALKLICEQRRIDRGGK